MRGTTIDILLVEDNPGDVKQFTSFMRGDFNVSVAVNGAEALDRVFRRGKFHASPVPDLVVLDLNTPLLNGHEVLNVLKSHSESRHLPVVIWSGSPNPNDIRRAYDLGASAYLLKMDDIAETESQLAAFGEFWIRKVRYPVMQAASSLA